MAKYGRKAQEEVERAMHERKRGTLRSDIPHFGWDLHST
jgi:hypothetical protein